MNEDFKIGDKAECHFTEEVVTIIAKGYDALDNEHFLIEYPAGDRQVSHVSCLVAIQSDTRGSNQ